MVLPEVDEPALSTVVHAMTQHGAPTSITQERVTYLIECLDGKHGLERHILARDSIVKAFNNSVPAAADPVWYTKGVQDG